MAVSSHEPLHCVVEITSALKMDPAGSLEMSVTVCYTSKALNKKSTRNFIVTAEITPNLA